MFIKNRENIREYLRESVLGFYRKMAEKKDLHGRRRIKKILKNQDVFDQYSFIFEKYTSRGVLDIGCSTGYFSLWMACYADVVYGIDVGVTCINYAKELQKCAGLIDEEMSSKVIFDTFSAFDLNLNYFKEKEIDTIFLHKVSGDWNDAEGIRFWKLCIDAKIKIIVININNRKRVPEDLLLDNGYDIKDLYSLFTIVEKK